MPNPPPTSSLELYQLSKKLVVACYELTAQLPAEEKTNLTRFIRSAGLTVHVNVAQGAFLKKKKQQKPFLREARNALVVIDACVEVLIETGLMKEDKTRELMELSSACYQMLPSKKDK